MPDGLGRVVLVLLGVVVLRRGAWAPVLGRGIGEAFWF